MPGSTDPKRPPLLGPGEGRLLELGGLGVRFMIDGEVTGGSFALVEHPLAPRALGAPLHTHSREDEYTYVLEGEIGFQLGDRVVRATPGDLVFKPRGERHAFWNPGDVPARGLELISPAGFERYFDEIAPLMPPDGPPDVEGFARVWEKYGIEMDPSSIGPLTEEHGLVVPGR